jgi:Ketopantoate hydroxymethyltransferase
MESHVADDVAVVLRHPCAKRLLRHEKASEIAARKVGGIAVEVVYLLGDADAGVQVSVRAQAQIQDHSVAYGPRPGSPEIDSVGQLVAAGACALVLEAVPTEAARRVTETVAIPTIGIGAGPFCDGQVLISTEMLGISAGPRPRYAKRYADLRTQISEAVRTFVDKFGTAPTRP